MAKKPTARQISTPPVPPKPIVHARTPTSPAKAPAAAPATTPAPSPANPSAATTGAARDILLKNLKAWGIDTSGIGSTSITGVIDGLVQNGTLGGSTDSGTIQLYLQDTPEWKQRFAGNEARKQAGLAPLSPAEYVSAESSYQQVLKAAGLPEGFYDHPDDFAKFIGSNTSPSEVQTRATAAVTAASNTDPGFRKMLQDYGYNLDTGQLAAYMLDPARALPTIQRQLNAAKIGGIAGDNGFGINTGTAERIGDLGLSDYQIQTAYGQAGAVVPGASKLGSIYGSDYSQTDAQNEFVFNDQTAARKRQGLTGKEQASFGGSSGTANGSLGQNSGGY